MLLALVLLAPVVGLLGLGTMPGFEPSDLLLWESRYFRRIIWFSLLQAGLSALLSVALAVVVARALFYRPDSAFRRGLLRLFALPLVVPSVVAVMGLITIYGSQGWLPIGRGLYGLQGILLAHVFFNMPLAVRLLMPVWQSIPQHHWQIAAQLDFNAGQRWRHLEWPMLREALPGVMLLIFMLCLTSFAVVLTLGGGPRSTTLEVAIYQSLRFDFDPVRAVILALVQLCLCATVALVTLRLQTMPEVEIGLDTPGDSNPRAELRWAGLIVALAALFVASPILSILFDAAAGPLLKVLSNPALWSAAAYSLIIGLLAALLSALAGWLILRSSSDLACRGRGGSARAMEAAASMVYVVPPLVIGTGFFILLSPHVNVFNWVFPIVILVNALSGLPFVVRTLGPAMRQNLERHDRLCQQLALQGWSRLRWVDWPLLRRPLGLSMALVAALAMGDLGVIALFGSAETATLPLLVYQQLGAYRIAEATVSAAILLFLCLMMFWLLERGVGGRGYA